ncbi:MAG: alpha/beta hydrolase fold domain-containing protein [Bacteroidales bacterium]|nr:alpha/beta hydrolase fold domain-containing protein [Bacteroidales bacterium]
MIDPRRFLAILLLIPCLGIAAPLAEEERLKPQWLALDNDGDGRVGLDEVHPMQAAAMRNSDFDGDGFISLAEYVAYDHDPGGAGQRPLADNVRWVADIPYAATDDPRQRLDIYLPKSAEVDGPLPVIAYVHGGAWRTGSRIMARSQVMAHVDSGRYAAISIGYRLSWQDSWPAQIHDLKAAIRWIRANADEYGLDPGRICALGPSAGGHLVAMLGTTNAVAELEGTLGDHGDQSSDVQCVIDFFGPADFRVADDAAIGGPVVELLGGHPAENPELAAAASPLHHVKAGAPPFLIVHGTRDPLVSHSDSVALTKALDEAGVPVIFQTVDGGGHGDFGDAAAEVERRVRAFLERNFYDPSVEVPSNTLKSAP